MSFKVATKRNYIKKEKGASVKDVVRIARRLKKKKRHCKCQKDSTGTIKLMIDKMKTKIIDRIINKVDIYKEVNCSGKR
jgi:hypothetical protein